MTKTDAPVDAALDAELLHRLPAAIQLLAMHRTADVPAGHLDAYVARGWMRWAAGRLLVTPEGQRLRDQLTAPPEGT
jgi:hypothetical protein